MNSSPKLARKSRVKTSLVEKARSPTHQQATRHTSVKIANIIGLLLLLGGPFATPTRGSPRVPLLALLGVVAAPGLLDRVRLRDAPLPLAQFGQFLEVLVQRVQLFLAKILNVDKAVARALDRRHQF